MGVSVRKLKKEISHLEMFIEKYCREGRSKDILKDSLHRKKKMLAMKQGRSKESIDLFGL